MIAYRNDPTKSAGQKILWQTAEEVLPRKEIAHFNQALMELGSLVCKPNNPDCESCPVAKLCFSKQAGIQSELPISAKKTKFTDISEAAIVVHKKGHVLLRQCAQGERWAGLWDFPRFEVEAEGPLFVRDELIAKVQQQTGIQIKPAALLTTLKHGVTRYRITLDCYETQWASGRIRSTAKKPVRWCSPSGLAELPLSSTGRKIARLVY